MAARDKVHRVYVELCGKTKLWVVTSIHWKKGIREDTPRHTHENEAQNVKRAKQLTGLAALATFAISGRLTRRAALRIVSAASHKSFLKSVHVLIAYNTRMLIIESVLVIATMSTWWGERVEAVLPDSRSASSEGVAEGRGHETICGSRRYVSHGDEILAEEIG